MICCRMKKAFNIQNKNKKKKGKIACFLLYLFAFSLGNDNNTTWEKKSIWFQHYWQLSPESGHQLMKARPLESTGEFQKKDKTHWKSLVRFVKCFDAKILNLATSVFWGHFRQSPEGKCCCFTSSTRSLSPHFTQTHTQKDVLLMSQKFYLEWKKETWENRC